jgi:hypothetical protein
MRVNRTGVLTTRLLAAALAAALTAACGGRQHYSSGGEVVGAVSSRADVDRHVANWAPASREAAAMMTDKYGPPAEQTATMLVWHATGPWKRTVIYREEVPHSFPRPHTDVMEQFVDYRVPPDKFDELAAYDGSVIAERTKGELSARCDKEAMNFLALNLANDIVTGRRTVAEARAEYARQATAFMGGQPAPYTEGLRFTPPKGGTGDPDMPAQQ